MPVWRWSKNAVANAGADPTIDWREGQAPSSINDSARAEMAAVAQWRDDISGAIVTGGSSTAFTLSSNQVFGSLNGLADLSGQVIAFTPGTTNTAAVTLNVDSLGAKPLRPAPGVELPSNSLIQGTPYTCIYSVADACFYLHGGLGSPYSVPLAGAIEYMGSVAPNSCFAFPIGQALNRVTFPKLWTLAQAEIAFGNSLYTNGDGSMTFTIPNLRGRVSVPPDASAGVFTPAALGLTGGVINGSQTLSTANLPAYTPSGTVGNDTPDHSHTDPRGMIDTPFGGGGGNVVPVYSPGGVQSSGASTRHTHPFSGNPQGGSSAAFSVAMPWIGVNKIMRVI